MVLKGDRSHLGAAGENAQWQIGGATRFVAVEGDLQINADLRSANGAYMSFQAARGHISMTADSEIQSPGALVTLTAAGGIEIGRIDTSDGSGLQGAVALDSPSGQIVLADAYANGMGVRAQSVSFFGYGQPNSANDGDRVLRVESERLQVSAPSGVASRGFNANGLYYRLMDKGLGYAQLQVLGQNPERVMVPTSEVAGQPAQAAASLALAANPSSGFAQQMHSLVWPAGGQSVGSVQAKAYVAGVLQPVVSVGSLGQKLQQGWILLNDLVPDGEDLLSDLAYGFSGEVEPSFVMGLPGLQPASSGLLPTNEVLFDYLVNR